MWGKARSREGALGVGVAGGQAVEWPGPPGWTSGPVSAPMPSYHREPSEVTARGVRARPTPPLHSAGEELRRGRLRVAGRPGGRVSKCQVKAGLSCFPRAETAGP